ncbi:MAG: glycosyltransferase family 4 protein, partial [Candidatus Eremiobacteraeota bacterium]|nr:glycosyltransferase family 4 protein [Candidatus Eremiobacteraeota bacterium]
SKDFPAPGQPEDGIVVLRQAQALAGIGHEILVVRIVPHAPPLTSKWRAYRSVPERYAIEGIQVAAVRAFFPPRMIAMEYLPHQIDRPLQRIARAFAPDVVHAHCLIPSGQLAVRFGIPAIITAHGSDAYDWAWRRRGLQRAAADGARRAGTVVAVSDFIRRRVQDLVARDVEVIYNGADEEVFAPSDKREAREALGISPQRFVIAFAGGPARIKGAFDLIDAIATMDELRPLALFSGPESMGPEIVRAASRSSVDARFCGMLNHAELARVFAAADAFCLPSYREGLPLVICEAMLAGRPVVASAVGGIPEIVTNDVHGFLVRAGDPAMLAKRLGDLASNPETAARMGEAAFQFARQNLTWQVNAQRYDALYRQLAGAAA